MGRESLPDVSRIANREAILTPNGGGSLIHGKDCAESCRTVTPAEYEQLSDRDMDTLHESLELLCEDYGQGEWECEYSVSRVLASRFVSLFP